MPKIKKLQNRPPTFLDLEVTGKIPLHRIRWIILPVAAIHFYFVEGGSKDHYSLLLWGVIAVIYLAATDIIWKFSSKFTFLIVVQILLDTLLISIALFMSKQYESILFLFYLIPIFYAADYFSHKQGVYLSVCVGCAYLGVEIIRIWMLDSIHSQVIPAMLIRLLFLAGASLAFVRSRDKKNKLETIVRDAAVGISIINPYTMTILFMNNTQREWFPNAKLGGICYNEYNSPLQDEPCSWCATLKALKSGKTERSTTHSPDPQAPYRIKHYDVIATPIKDKRGKIVAIVEAVTDITDVVELIYLKSTSTNILEDKDVIQSLVDFAKKVEAEGCALIIFDLETENATIKQYIPGKSAMELDIPTSSFPALKQLLELAKPIPIQSMRSGQTPIPSAIVEVARKNNFRPAVLLPVVLKEKVWAAIMLQWMVKRGIQFSDEDLQLYENTASAVKMLLNRVHIANEVQRASESKEQVIKSLRHELLGPVSQVADATTSAIGTKDDHAELEKQLKRLQESSLRMKSIFSKVITASRIERKMLVLDRKPIDIIEALSKAKANLNYLAEENEVKVDIENMTGTDRQEIDADPDLFFGVIENLLSNAIRYNNKGGNVDVFVEKGNQCFIVKFIDTGIGIAQEERQEIFKEGYRTKEAKTKWADGSGLGLFIVKSILKEHGWDIKVESELGKGSCFTVIIPKGENENAGEKTKNSID